MATEAANYPNCLRMRRPATTKEAAASDFNRGQTGGMDERTLLKLLGVPTLTTCIYRANEFLRFLAERLAVIALRTLPVMLLPLLLMLIAIYVHPDGSGMFLEYIHDDQVTLQFIVLVIVSCHSLVILAVAVDYSTVLRISRESLEKSRQSQDEGFKTTGGLQALKGNIKHLYNMLLNGRSESVVDDPDSMALAPDANASNIALVPSDSSPESTDVWWDTYALLRLIVHCFFFLMKQSAHNVVSNLGSKRKEVARRMKSMVSGGVGHNLLSRLSSKAVRLLLLLLFIIIALLCLTGVKAYRLKEFRMISDWMIESRLWTASLACGLQLHFITLLAVAVLVSRAPSRIRMVGLLGRWLFTLVVCIVLQVAVLPGMGSLPGCISNRRDSSDILAVFSNVVEGFSDSAIVNSLGGSQPSVAFVLNSIITAIIASVLYQLGILRLALASIGTLFECLFDVSPVECMAILVSVYATQINLLVLIMPYLGKLSESELFSIFLLLLVRTPSQGDEYWNLEAAAAHSSESHAMQTYIPERAHVRNLLCIPLVILFSRIIYPVSARFRTRAMLFRRLRSLNCGRPFRSLYDSLLVFVAYCIRSLCRYIVMFIFLLCVDYIIRFLLQTIDLKIKSQNVLGAILVDLAFTPVTLLTDMTNFYPSWSRPLSHYIKNRFIFPHETFSHSFLEDVQREFGKNTTGSVRQVFEEIFTPAKEIVVTGSLTWDTILVFVAFTSECLYKDHQVKASFLIRGCTAALLVYCAMHNLLLLMCEPTVLRKFYKISRQWIKMLVEHVFDSMANNCDT